MRKHSQTATRKVLLQTDYSFENNSGTCKKTRTSSPGSIEMYKMC